MTKPIATAHYSSQEFFEKSGMPLNVLMIPEQIGHNFHDHDVTELVVVTKGWGLHATRQEKYPIEAGNVFVIQACEQHAYRDTHDLAICNVLFDLPRLKLPLGSLSQSPGYRALFSHEPRLRHTHGVKSHLKLSPAKLAVVTDLFSNVIKELELKNAGFECMASALFMQILAYLARCYSNIEDPESRSVLRLSMVLDHMENTMNQPLRLDTLARMANMSLSTFQRAFSKTLHTSPMDYLIRLRIQKACELLSKDTLNITEVAAATGFEDSNYFTRQFRRIMRASPRDFRNQMRTGSG